MSGLPGGHLARRELVGSGDETTLGAVAGSLWASLSFLPVGGDMHWAEGAAGSREGMRVSVPGSVCSALCPHMAAVSRVTVTTWERLGVHTCSLSVPVGVRCQVAPTGVIYSQG